MMRYNHESGIRETVEFRPVQLLLIHHKYNCHKQLVKGEIWTAVDPLIILGTHPPVRALLTWKIDTSW